MNIETKFNIGETVFLMYDNEVQETVIEGTRIEISAESDCCQHEFYAIDIDDSITSNFSGDKLFKTLKEVEEFTNF